jgi:hypothetical protein
MIDAGKTSVTLRITPTAGGRFEVRQGERLLGTSQNEMMALWSAVAAAEHLAKSGQTVRAVASREGQEVEEFVASPSPPA